VLSEARSDDAGEWVIDGLSSSASFFALRVLLPGYAAFERDVQRVEGEPIVAVLQPTEPVRGRVDLPAGVAAVSLSVRAYRCAGSHAPVQPDGSFVLDHFPPPPTPVRLLVHGLPEGLTHAARHAIAGEEGVTLAIVRSGMVRGVVVTADRDLPIAGAYVQHEHGPRAGAGTYTDANGRFELGGLPAGEVRLDAFGGPPRLHREPGEPDRRQVPYGFAEVVVDPARAAEGVVVRVH
jgi:hypothetical protein